MRSLTVSPSVLYSDSMGDISRGAFLTRTFHPVFSASSILSKSSPTCASIQGLFAKSTASPVTASKKVPDMPTSFGIVSSIILADSCCGRLIDSSVRTTMRFFIVLTMFETSWLFCIR